MFLILSLAILVVAHTGYSFEGGISAVVTSNGETQKFLYTVKGEQVRIERTETNNVFPINIVDLKTGRTTLIQPFNRTFVVLTNLEMSVAPNNGVPFPSAAPTFNPPAVPQVPQSTNPAAAEAFAQMRAASRRGSGSVPAVGANQGAQIAEMIAAMRAGGKAAKPELKLTGGVTNILGLECRQYEIKFGNDVMKLWATATLVPFPVYHKNQARKYGTTILAEEWSPLLRDAKLFPMSAVLSYVNGPERYRFEVTNISPQKSQDEPAKTFAPPRGFQELPQMPF